MILKDLLSKVNITSAEADMTTEIHGISYDTRRLGAGEIFVAVAGYESDGHEYIEQAAQKGAVCVVCERPPEIQIPYVLVESSRKALAVMSANWFDNPAERLKIIGVTGTNGKTTVTSLLKEILEKCKGAKVGLIGTNGSLIGDKYLNAERTTPESYELQELFRKMADEGCEYAVMEVSSHALYLDRVFGIEFEVGVFTNLTPDHLDFHETMDDYAKVKAQMFSKCRHSVINIDSEYEQLMRETAGDGVYTYSIGNDSADLVAKSTRVLSDRVEFCVVTIGSIQRVELGIPGRFSVYNALAAISAALQLGIGMENTAAALQTCGGVKGRAEVVPAERGYTVLIDYAHTPDALENIISAVGANTAGRVITLFGCGGDRDRKKRPLMGEVAARLSDVVVVTSDNPRTEKPRAIIDEILKGMKGTKTPCQVIENRREAIAWALENAQDGDIVILAGKGHETYQIFGKEKTHFDEREVVAEILMEQDAR